MNPLSKVNDEVTAYFTFLGYQVDWDFSHRDNVRWYEIIKDGELVVQIDIGPSLADIVEDLTCMARGLEKGTSKASDYTIAAEDGPAWDALIQAVAKNPL